MGFHELYKKLGGHNYLQRDRWWFFQDSVIIKDQSFLQTGWRKGTSVPLSNSPTAFGMYLGIYSRATLDKVGIPVAQSKADAIRYEVEWHFVNTVATNLLK